MSSKSPTPKEIWNALGESLKFQSHYAVLLNQLDGGERMTFDDPHAWIQRLREVKTVITVMQGGGKECIHVRVIRGKDVPRLYGSWRTQVCEGCGAFRTHGHNDSPEPSKLWVGHDWRPASEYADAVNDLAED